MGFPSDDALSGTCDYFNHVYILGLLTLPFQLPCLILIRRKINKILDCDQNKSYCLISLWMMYLIFLLFIFYAVGSMCIIAIHFMSKHHISKIFIWRLICYSIGNLGVILGTLIGCFVMA